MTVKITSGNVRSYVRDIAVNLPRLLETAAGQLAAQIVSAVLTLFVARKLGPTLTGDLAVVYTVSTIVSLFFNWGLDLWLHESLLKEANQQQALVGKINRVRVRLGGASIPLSAIVWWITTNRPELSPLILVAGCELLLDGCLGAVIIGEHSVAHHKLGSRLLVLHRVLKLAAVAALFGIGMGSLAEVVVTRLMAAAPILVLYLVKTNRLTRVPAVSAPAMRDIIRHSGIYALLNGLSLAYGQVDVLLLGLLLPGGGTVGYYSQAMGILMSTMALPYAAYLVVTRTLAARVKKSGQKGTNAYAYSMALFVLIGLLLAAFLYFIGPGLLLLLLGDAYATSAHLVALQFGTVFLKSVNLGLASLMVVAAIRRPRAVVQGISLFVNLTLNLLLIPNFGAVAAVFVYTFSEGVLMVGYAATVAHRLRKHSMTSSQA
ncbi:MAG: oligosaccharide flippase family protein [Thermoflexales bacterium]|nr:oligosaccharide flippase family protein [Thermoflexales bacterium]